MTLGAVCSLLGSRPTSIKAPVASANLKAVSESYFFIFFSTLFSLQSKSLFIDYPAMVRWTTLMQNGGARPLTGLSGFDLVGQYSQFHRDCGAEMAQPDRSQPLSIAPVRPRRTATTKASTGHFVTNSTMARSFIASSSPGRWPNQSCAVCAVQQASYSRQSCR